jgi:hypothetical protein
MKKLLSRTYAYNYLSLDGQAKVGNGLLVVVFFITKLFVLKVHGGALCYR